MDTNVELEHPNVFYLLLTALLSVCNSPMMEETLYLFSVAMCPDSRGVETDEEGHRPIHPEDKVCHRK